MSLRPIPDKEKGPLAWMAGNSVAANLLMIVLLVGGLMVARNVKQEVFPEFSTDMVTMTIAYPGATPEEVENGIVQAAEQAVEGLEGVKEISSTASEGHATMTVEALEGANIIKLWQDVESAISQVDTFPEEAREPKIAVVTHKREVIAFALYGDHSERTLRQTAENLRDEFLQNPEITQVELTGVRDYQIHVEIPRDILRRFGLTLSEVAGKIAQASVEVGGGSLKTSAGDILLRMDDRRESVGEYAEVPLLIADDGSRLSLSDVAAVSEGFEESDRWGKYNGLPAVRIEVYRVGDQTPVGVATAAKKVADRINQQLPGGMKLAVVRDSSEIFQDRAELLLSNAYLGLSLVFVFLALFLEARLAFWVSLGIPISFLGSFLLLPLAGFTINMITMFAFIVTLGIVVDDAIVVGENIHHHRTLGKSPLQASIDGAREVAMPVVFSVITNIVTFMPLYFVPGVMGKVFKMIPIVVASVFFISLIESLLVLPAHLAHGATVSKSRILARIERVQGRFSAAFERFVKEKYGPFLAFTLNHRYSCLALALAVLIGTVGFVLSGRMGLEMMPKVESDYAYAEAVLPYGSPVKRINEVESRLITAAQKVIEENGGDDLAKGIFTYVNENTISLRLYLQPAEQRPMGAAAVCRKWREATGPMAGLESISFESDRGGPGGGKSLTVRLSHRDKAQLDKAGEELAEILSEYSNTHDVDDGSAQGKRQYDIRLLPAGERMGLTSREVATQLRGAFYGAEALRQQRGRNEITILVRLPESERVNESTLEDLILRAPDGGEILLRDAAELHPGKAYTSIEHSNGRRIIEVTANVRPHSAAQQVSRNLDEDVMPGLMGRYPGLSYSFEGHQAEMRDSMSSLITGLLMSLLLIYALLAIPFRSYYQPVIIMFCIPFGIVGAIFGHLLMGYSLSIMSLFGVVALSGVVVNDSLVFIDFTNRKVREGEPVQTALIQAGTQRFRPIMLTTITTFSGLGPMIFETSRQARFLIPMAISLGFGILFATVITLVMVPSLYMIMEDIFNLFRHKDAKTVMEEPALLEK